MVLLNKKVQHKIYGVGTVISETADRITVAFAAKTSVFIFPKAFEKDLVCEDAELQETLHAAALNQIEAERTALLAKHEENKRARAAGEIRITASRSSAPSYARYSAENNLAFKCNYCDGGRSRSCVGFKWACSDEQIRYNIEVAKRTWCSNWDSACSQYYDGYITREELDEQCEGSNFVCYESKMLVDWTAQAGDDLDADGNHKGRRIGNATRDSLAVLTTEFPKDKQRYIFGVFITGTVDEGDEGQSGYVKALGDFKIELTPEETRKMPFWKYYKNKNGDEARWGTGLYRYIKDTVAARILADIVELKKGKAKAHAQKVLEHYCELKDIDINNIPAADGLLAN